LKTLDITLKLFFCYTDAWETDANIKYLRYAEVVLMKAEALNELDQTPAAILLLNQIRTRAELGNTAAVSKAEVRTAIWKKKSRNGF
jgi:hypothetical protein